jgi:hypothetical protein
MITKENFLCAYFSFVIMCERASNRPRKPLAVAGVTDGTGGTSRPFGITKDGGPGCHSGAQTPPDGPP